MNLHSPPPSNFSFLESQMLPSTNYIAECTAVHRCDSPKLKQWHHQWMLWSTDELHVSSWQAWNETSTCHSTTKAPVGLEYGDGEGSVCGEAGATWTGDIRTNSSALWRLTGEHYVRHMCAWVRVHVFVCAYPKCLGYALQGGLGLVLCLKCSFRLIPQNACWVSDVRTCTSMR